MSRASIKERYEGVQTFLTESCLFLTLMSIAEEYSGQKNDLLDLVKYARRMKYINENNELTVEGQCALLRDLTGKEWRREVLTKLPATVPEEMWTVEKWQNARTGYVHFKRRYMDTLVDSVTVKEGVIVAYYAYIVEE